jgi:hypothetical protein
MILIPLSIEKCIFACGFSATSAPSDLLYSLTHSWSWALIEKLPIVQPLKNFPAFYGTRRFITTLLLKLTYILRFLPPLPLANLLYTYIQYSKCQISYNFLSFSSFIQGIRPGPRLLLIFRNNFIFYSGELLAPRPTPNLEAHPLSTVRDCVCIIFAATLHTWRASPPSGTWGRAMPWWQVTHLTWGHSTMLTSITW